MPALQNSPQYLAQRELSGEILGTNGELLPAWKEHSDIAKWSSKLSCHLAIDEWLKRHGGYADDDGGDANCFVVRKAIETSGDGVIVCNDDIHALLADVVRWHNCYCELLEKWLHNAIGVKNLPRPECRMTLADVTWAGQYSPIENICDYSMAFAMIVGMVDGGVNASQGFIGKGFYTTIAHECCHAYQNAFTGVGTGHGGDFYALMKHACQLPITQHKHSYDTAMAQKVARSLVPWWKRQLGNGSTVSLPCGLDTRFVKRAESID